MGRAGEAQPLLRSKGGGKQAIAHRGFKAAFPENTLAAFAGALAAGAHAVETDLHLSADGVIMLCHDATLERCFGAPGRVVDFPAAHLQTLRTLRAPRERMPTLAELLGLLRERGGWALLDIKPDNDPELLMRRLRETVEAAAFPYERVVLGCWRLEFLPLAEKYLPDSRKVYIGFSIPYAYEFLSHPGVDFNMFHAALASRSGQRFLRDAKAAGRRVYAWTVNKEDWMKWMIAEPNVDGVLTDEVVKLLALDPAGDHRLTWRMWLWVQVSYVLAWGFLLWKFGGPGWVGREVKRGEAARRRVVEGGGGS